MPDSLLATDLKLFSVFTSGLLAGSTGYISLTHIPSLLSAPSAPSSALHSQWTSLYRANHRLFPAASFLTSLAFAETAYLEHQNGKGPWWPWAVAAGLTSSVMPYTRLFMMKDIRALGAWKEAEGVKALQEGIKSWRWWNVARAEMHAIAFGLGIWGLLKGGERDVRI